MYVYIYIYIYITTATNNNDNDNNDIYTNTNTNTNTNNLRIYKTCYDFKSARRPQRIRAAPAPPLARSHLAHPVPEASICCCYDYR